MSVLSRRPPFHTAALTITSITRNYLAVFPLPRPIGGAHLGAGIICVSAGCQTPHLPGGEEEEEEESGGIQVG